MSDLPSLSLRGNLRSALEDYLGRLGRLQLHALCPVEEGVATRPAKEEDNESLKRQLASASETRNPAFILCVVFLCFIFVLLVGLLVHSVIAKQPIAVGAVGSFVVMFWPIIRWLRRVWIDSTLLRLVQDALVDLPPQEAVKVIEIVYWGSLRRKK
jgi:hypothetical protein